MPDRSTNENRWVEAYLQYVATGELPMDPNREARRQALEAQIEGEAQLYKRVTLVAQLLALDDPGISAKELEARFLDYGATFGERNHITYKAWRAMGVPAKVLKAMGLSEQRMTKPRDPDRPKQQRYRQTEEHAEYVFGLWEKGGQQAIIDALHLAPHYITTNLRDLARKYPDIAKRHGYDHEAEVRASLAKTVAHAQAKRAEKVAAHG